VQLSILALLTGNEGTWMALEDDEAGDAGAAFGLPVDTADPIDLLSYLANAAADLDAAAVAIIDLYDHGVTVDITPPPADKVISADDVPLG